MVRPALSLPDHFSTLKDPRQAAKVLYPLPEILLLLLCATLAGADDLAEVEVWGEEQLSLLRRFLPYRSGVPSHDTLGDVLAALDPDLFKRCFTSWVEGLREAEPDLVAVDGKTSRRSHARGKGREPLHLVSAWASRQRLVLGQEAVTGKSNEISAIPLLLERLALEGALVTIDAIGTQSGIAEIILKGGGDYLLALKANRPATLKDVEAFFSDPPPGALDRWETTDGDHGRIEIRRAEVVHDVAWLAEAHAWPGLRAVGKVAATRESDGRTTTATRYYLLSKPLAAARFAEIVRTHWQIENRLHWVLDTAMDEDRSRSRKDHGPENLARLRRFALNLIRTNPTKGSTRGKIKRAAWDDQFLLDILRAA